MLIRVVIADDEPFIRNCLVSSIDWARHGVQIVKVCKNGREVLDCLAECQPDLVISDVKMPVMDGMELLTHIREGYPKIHVIIISGYEEFGFVKHAIDYDADGYLLKPVEPDILLHKVEKVVTKIQEERKREAARKDVRYILNAYIRGEVTAENLDGSEDILERLETCFFASACVQIDQAEQYAAAKHRLGAVSEKLSGVLFFPNLQHCHVLLSYDADAQTAQERIEAAARLTEDLLEGAEIQEFRIAVGGARFGLDALLQSLDDAKETMLLRYVNHAEKVFYRKNSYAIHYPSYEAEIKALLGAIFAKNQRKAAQTLDGAFAKFYAEKQSVQDLKTFANSLVFQIVEQLRSVALSHKINEYSTSIYLCHDPKQLEAYLRSFLNDLIAYLAETKDDSDKKMIGEIKEYIRSHLSSSELSLGSLAKHLNHNPSYVSYMFSNACGVTITNYIMIMRIESAKRIIRDTDQKLLAVSMAVGYENPSYFCKIFRRYVGMSPKEYRVIEKQ